MGKIIDFFAERFLPYVESNNATHDKDNFAQKNRTLSSENNKNSSEKTIEKDNYAPIPRSETDSEVQKYQELSKLHLQNNQNNSTEKPEQTDNQQDFDRNPANKELSASEKQMIEELKQIDKEVRNHEAAHRRAGGNLVRGGTAFTYRNGPDGKQYAVAGEVKIDFSYDMDKPDETIRKMQQVKRAALAPSDPSTQDRAVATKANSIESRARIELMKERAEDSSPKNIAINFLEKKYLSSEFENDSSKTSSNKYSKLI